MPLSHSWTSVPAVQPTLPKQQHCFQVRSMLWAIDTLTVKYGVILAPSRLYPTTCRSPKDTLAGFSRRNHD